MARVGVTAFDPADTVAGAICIDPASGRGWVGCDNRIVQFLLGAPASPPSRETHTDSFFPIFLIMKFHPITRQIVAMDGGTPTGGVFDVSGTAPRSLGLFLETTSVMGQPDIDVASGLLYGGLVAGEQGVAKYAVDGSANLPARLPAPAGPLVDFLIQWTAVDAPGGFIYGAGLAVGGGPLVAFRQPPAPGPDLHGYVNKLKVKSSASKSSVKAQLFLFNNGTANAGSFIVRTFLSDDDRLSYDDVEIGKPRTVKKLDTGKVRKLGANAPVSGPIAGKFLIVVIDGEKAAGDGHYGNNVFVSRRL